MPPDIVITLRADDLTSAAFQEVKQQLLELGRLEARVNQDSEKLLVARRRHLQALAETRTANANARIAGERTEQAAIEQETAFREASSRQTLANIKNEEDARRRAHQTNQTAIRNEEAANRRSHQTNQTAIRNEEAERKRSHQTNQTAIRNEESAKRRAHQTSQTAIRNEEAANRRSHQTNQTAIRAEQSERNRAHQTNQTAIRNEESAKRRVHQSNISNTNAEIARDRIAAQNRSLDLREQTLAERRLDRERRDAFGNLRGNQERVRRGFLSWETLLSHIGSIIAFEVVFQVANLARHVVEVSAEFERLRLGLQTINEDPFVADVQIRRLRELAELPGVGFASGLRSVTSLRGAGITFEQAERLLREISNVATLSGATQEDVGEALRQFRQSFSAQAFTQQDLRPILQRIPLLQPAFLDVFGSIQAGDVNRAIRSERLSFEQAFDRLLVRLESGPRANPETFTNAVERLVDSFDDLARDFGNDLLPVLKNLVDALNRFFQFLRTPFGRTVLAGGVGALSGAFTGAAISLSRGAGALAGLGVGSALGGGGISFFPPETGESRRLSQQLRFESQFNRYSFQERIAAANDAAQLAEHRRLRSIARQAGQEFPYEPEEIGSPLSYLQQRRAALAASPSRFVRVVATPLPGFISGAILGGTTAAAGQYAVTAAQRVNRGEDVNILDRFTSFIGGGGFGTPGLNRDVFSGLFATRTGASSADVFENFQQLQDTLASLASPASATVRFTKALQELREELVVSGDITNVNARTLEEYNQTRIAFERSSTQALEALELRESNVNAEIRRIFRSGRIGPDGQVQYIRRYQEDRSGELDFILDFRRHINTLRREGEDLDELYNRISTEGLVEKITGAERERLDALIEERKGIELSIRALTKSIGARRREADEIDKLAEETVDAPRPTPSLPDLRISPTQAVRDPRAVEEERTYVGQLQEDARDLEGRPLARYQVRGPGTINPRTGKITYQRFGDFGVTDVTFRRRPEGQPGRSLADLSSGTRRTETPTGTRYGTTPADSARFSPLGILDDVVETARVLNRGFGTLASDIEQINLGFQQTLGSIETDVTRLAERRQEISDYADEWERLKETIEDTIIVEERQATTVNTLQDSRFGEFLRDLGGIRQREGFGLDRTISDTLIRPLDLDTVRETIKELRDLENEIVQLISTSESLDAVPRNIFTILDQIRNAIRSLQQDIQLTRDALMDLREIEVEERVRFTPDQQADFNREFFGTESGQPPTREQIFNLPFFRVPRERERQRQQQREEQRAQAFASYFEQASESLYDQFIAPSILDAVGIGSGQSAAQERAIENLTRSVEEARQRVREDETLNARQQAEQLLEINREYEREKREIERSYEEERSDAWKNWVRQQLTDFPKLIFQQLQLQLAARTTNFILNSLGIGGGVPITGTGFGGGGGAGTVGGVGQAANLAGRFARLRAGTGQAIGTGAQAAGYAGVAYSGYQAARGVYEVARGGGFNDLVGDIGRIPAEIGSFFSGLHFNNPLNDELARIAGSQRAQSDAAYQLGRSSARDIVRHYDEGYSEGSESTMDTHSTGNTYVVSGDTNFNMPIQIGDREIRQISFTMDEMMSDRRL